MHAKPKAFTFIEVIVALSVVALALSALIRMQLISINLTERTEMTTQAVLLAEEKMAELMTGSSPSSGIIKGTVNRNGRDFFWQSEIQNLHYNLQITVKPNITQIAGSAPKPNADNTSLNYHDMAPLRRVEISVHWLDSRTKKQVQLTSYLAKRSLQ